jgi:hypothetical protein
MIHEGLAYSYDGGKKKTEEEQLASLSYVEL